MKSTSTLWAPTIAGTHQIQLDVLILFNRIPIREVAVVSGSVTQDRTAAQSGRCSLVLAEPTLIPTLTAGYLAPFGAELQISRGIRYSAHSTETVPLGVFPIQSSQIDGVSLTTTVTGVDRSQTVADARLEDDYTIAAGTNYATAIQSLISDGVPGLTYLFVPTGYTTPLLVFPAQTDRWAAAQGMATSIGCELLFDGAGRCVMRAEDGTVPSPALSIAEGAGGILVSASLKLDRSTAYNRVVATGENTTVGVAPPRGVWTDDNPASPTYYFGAFGHKPMFYSSPFITSNAQAASAAYAIGSAGHGVGRSLDFAAVPNPALETGDAVIVKRTALGINELHVIDTLTIDLSAAGAMTGTSRLLQSS